MDLHKLKELIKNDGRFIQKSSSEYYADSICLNDHSKPVNLKIEFSLAYFLVKWRYKEHVSAGKIFDAKEIPDGNTIDDILTSALKRMATHYGITEYL